MKTKKAKAPEQTSHAALGALPGETAVASGGDGWRTWAPDGSPEHTLVGIVGVAREVATQYGPRMVVAITATAAGEDAEGTYDVDDAVDVWVSAGLRPLAMMPVRTQVRIVPNGWGGKDGKRREYLIYKRATRPTPDER